MCVREEERKREREKDRQRENERERERDRGRRDKRNGESRGSKMRIGRMYTRFGWQKEG